MSACLGLSYKIFYVTCICLLFSALANAEGRRVALVIANSQYQNIAALQNPLADGEAVAKRLRLAGFELLHPVRADDVQADLNLGEMLKAEESLQQAAAGAEMVLLFYSGHGLQMDGAPYLVPVELPRPGLDSLQSEAGRKLLKRSLMELDDLVAGLDQSAGVAVAMFDACREIPQLEQASKAVFGGDSPFRGLARLKPGGRHRIVAYSASSGELAKDGTGQPHSPYVQAWLDEFDQNAGQKDLTAFFLDVAAQVPDSRGQNPEVAITGVHSGSYYFQAAAQAKPAEPAPAKPAEIPAASELEQAEQYYLAKDYLRALPLYRKLADNGNGFAQFRMGVVYRNGFGVPLDEAEAVAWYKRSAQSGDAFGQYFFGLAYAQGQSVSVDASLSSHWRNLAYKNNLFNKAQSLANRGDPVAQNLLWIMYTAGEGVKQDEKQSLQWLRKSAEQGYWMAQKNLGGKYQLGQGLEQDKAQAVAWYRKAAEQGSAEAQFKLGWMYSEGEGIAQDKTQAVAWYRKAAEQGHATAQANLGVMYDNGEGIAQDKAQALTWYRKAAEQGDAAGQNNMGGMYANGEGGLQQDFLKAAEWYRKAIANNDQKIRKTAEENLARIKPRLP